MPVGWVYAPHGLPLTVKKPTSNLLNPYFDSDVWISTLHVPDADRAGYADKWSAGYADKRSAGYADKWSARWGTLPEQTETIDLPRLPGQKSVSPIRCIRILGGLDGLLELNCISDDAIWSFMFTGRESDLRDAATIMRTFAANSNPPR
jgi:hypothetical protein